MKISNKILGAIKFDMFKEKQMNHFYSEMEVKLEIPANGVLLYDRNHFLMS